MQIQRFGNPYRNLVMKNYYLHTYFIFLGMFLHKGKLTYSPFFKIPPKSKNQMESF